MNTERTKTELINEIIAHCRDSYRLEEGYGYTLDNDRLPFSYLRNSAYEHNVWMIPYTQGSDYGGDNVTLVNCEYFRNTYPTIVIDMYGGYGSFGTAITRERLELASIDDLEELLSDIESLDEYPVLDEDRLWELEHELLVEFVEEFKEYNDISMPVQDIIDIIYNSDELYPVYELPMSVYVDENKLREVLGIEED